MGAIEILLIAGLIIIFLIIGYVAGKLAERLTWENNLDSIRGDAIKRSRSVLTGNFSEQLAPFMPGFNHSPTEARFIGKPVDFIIFEGLDQKEVSRVVFVEVKSGKASCSPVETSLKKTIQAGRVGWEIYRAPEKPDNGVSEDK